MSAEYLVSAAETWLGLAVSRCYTVLRKEIERKSNIKSLWSENPSLEEEHRITDNRYQYSCRCLIYGVEFDYYNYVNYIVTALEKGGNLTPILTREPDKHQEGANMEDLLVHSPNAGSDFDFEGIPQFLARVFEAQATGSLSAEGAIFICEDIARVYGPKIAPQIGSIMSITINCLMSNSESTALYQACSKGVVAVARYAIDPLIPAEKKEDIIDSICRPLSDSLLGSKESLAYGAALCLQALIDSDNWENASNEIVNEICVKVSGALEEDTTQTDAHMGLVMALAKQNSLIIEAYAGLLIRTGLRILRIGLMDADSLKQLSAIQMVDFIMKCVDRRSIYSELENVTEEMKTLYSDFDQLPSVKHAAFEALTTVSAIICNTCSGVENDSGSETCSCILKSSSSGRKVTCSARDGSPVSVSPEYEYVNSFNELESLSRMPLSPGQRSCNLDYTSKSKLWENGINDLELSSKDDLCPCIVPRCKGSKTHSAHAKVGGTRKNGKDHLDILRSRSNFNDIDILATPRKFIGTDQDSNDVNSDFSMKQTRKTRSKASRRLEPSLARKVDGSCRKSKFDHIRIPESRKRVPGSKTVSSIDDVASNVVGQDVHCVDPHIKGEIHSPNPRDKAFIRSLFNSFCYLLLIVSILTLLVMWLDGQEVSLDVAPT
ncbi:hypothetical protein Scep_014430 [Stephania cephalantha]|uniref:ARM repeat superfamily protein n=1 Tax=Stephania cephalantha TaxID=152367 RepID=A0AAP0J184_9MAGN